MSSTPTVWMTTLGCAKNEVDSDKVAAMLTGAGFETATEPGTADVVMVNTCAFIEDARRESVDTILDVAESKRDDARLVVIGCMAQRYEHDLADALPEVDAVIGLDRYAELVPRLGAMTGWQPIQITSPPPRMDILYQTARPTPTTPYAYVKIAEGCDKTCSFCAIPQFRGKQRSRSPADLRAEVAHLVSGGVSEVVLVAQDLAAFGRDLGRGAADIVELIDRLSDVDGLRRIRLLYLYPKEIRPGLIRAMATNDLVADYFDLSLQHATRRLLRAMRRPGSGVQYLELINRIRAESPDAVLRSSFIVGFPGETEDDVDELAGFLEAAQLDWAGFFAFSAEPGTDAADLPDQVPEQVKQERLRHLHNLQDDITAARNAAQRGNVVIALVDQVENGQPVGRSHRQAPDIDGVILLDQGDPGDWVKAEITGGYGTDLVATVVGPA